MWFKPCIGNDIYILLFLQYYNYGDAKTETTCSTMLLHSQEDSLPIVIHMHLSILQSSSKLLCDLQFVHNYHYGYIHSSELMHYLQEYIDSNDKRFSHCSCSLYPIFTYDYNVRLPPSSESRLQLLYKRNVRTSTDPYKKAVYCLLARCDINDNHSHVLIKTEDYMWLKVRTIGTIPYGF